ncbi:hypothetical protein EWM64_g9328 [Hericium alpestre]|uniref:Polysaccharide lyase 14 domain-containing protein n=1 Tax=Hericium alpestre TaxID=135208 RepID=A0A4Y9ZJQ8_9AGAM|nr:hypothetical protein EWM64_g9328 [Hericium alpestre]
MARIILLSSLLIPIFLQANAASSTPASAIAAQYSLTASTAIPFPTATMSNSDTQSFITSNWNLLRNKIENGASFVDFVADPFPNAPAPGSQNASGPVLQVTYPVGSFSAGNQGGTQMVSMFNSSSAQPFEAMLVTYEIAFDQGYQWVKGGKLPGLRGGPELDGCSGGNQANGTNCFSTRLMWRTSGQGEVYAYVPRTDDICPNSKRSLTESDGVICDDKDGISIDRGSFAFSPGQWQRISLVVRLNNPPNVANGQITLYNNDQQALTKNDVQIRTSDAVYTAGLYISTFFGGGDDSWAPNSTMHTYFRNFQVFAGTAPSNLTRSTARRASR